MDSGDANILDAESINWRVIAYPIAAILILLLAGFGYYYNQQYQRTQLESQARAALVAAKTPEEMVKVADQFPHTDQGSLALLGAAAASFDKRDFEGAKKDYQRVVSTVDVDNELRDSAQLGLASALEAAGKVDDAIVAYLVVAHRGDKSPYAPYGFNSATRLYEQKGDKEDARKLLIEAASLDPDSGFVKQAQYKLKQLNAAAQPPMTVQVPGSAGPAPARVAPPAPPVSSPTPAAKP